MCTTRDPRRPVSDGDPRPQIRVPDQPARTQCERAGPISQSARTTDRNTSPSVTAAEQRLTAPDPDLAFSCEWWPPDEL
jgi:hypothetical protein